MAVLTEPTTFGDWLVMEGDKRYSRDDVTLLTGKKYVSGEVLGVVTATGKHTALDEGAADGTEIAAAVLMDDVDALGGDMPGVVIARHAQVVKGQLTWPTGIAAGDITTALGQLKSAGILGV